MKKLLIIFAAAIMSANVTMAEDSIPTLKNTVVENGFWDNWFVEAGFDWNMFYSNQEAGLGLNKSPFKDFRSSPGFSVGVGKWFIPKVGVRARFQGLWGRAVCTEVKNSYRFYNVQLQGMLNMHNIFGTYRPDRIWNLSLFAGAGFNSIINGTNVAFSWSAGLHSSWRVAKNLDAYIEGGLLFNEHDADNVGESRQVSSYWKTHDQMPYAEVGITYNFGKKTTKWKRAVDTDKLMAQNRSAVQDLQNQLATEKDKNANINAQLDAARKALAEKPKEQKVTEKVVECPPVSVFFRIGRSILFNSPDVVNLKALAEFAKAHNSKVKVTGYADAATGNVSINNTLADARAKYISKKLQSYGINADNIIVESKGGVDDLDPTKHNRRVIVQIAE